jgi:hypothetical protein
MAMNMAGARVCSDDEKSCGEEEVRDLGFIPAAENVFYSRPGSVAFIGSVGVASVDRAPCSSPPSCFLPEEEEDRIGTWAG